MSYGSKESRIKQRVANIIKEFRSLLSFTEYNVTIDELKKEADNYNIKGKYVYQGFGSDTKEEGTFDISLTVNELEPVKTLITKKS